METNEQLEEKVVEVVNNGKPDDKKKKKKDRIKYISYLFFVIAITAGSIWYALYNNFNEVIGQIMSSDKLWLLVIFGIMVLAAGIRSFVFFCFARLYTRDYRFYRAIAVDQIGIFYNAVTPSSSGGQVMQAYTYKKQGIAISSAVSIMAMYSILFQIVLIIYGVLAFIMKYDAINSIGTIKFQIADWAFNLPIWPLTIIGFLLNVSVISIVLLMGYWKGFHNFIMGPVISLLAKIKLVKNPDKKRESLRVQVENFKIEMRRLFANIPFTILIVFCFFLLMTVKDAIPYFVGKALGSQSTAANFWDAVFLSNYHQMVTGLIPTPGSAGVSEYFFSRLFVATTPTASNSFYFSEGTAEQVLAAFTKDGISMQEAIQRANTTASNSLASAALLIWRSLTFIIPVFVSGLVTAFYRASPKDDIETVPNRQTFVTLQSETLFERAQEVATLVETSRLKRDEILKALKGGSKIKKKTTDKKSKVVHAYDDVKIDHEDDSI